MEEIWSEDRNPIKGNSQPNNQRTCLISPRDATQNRSGVEHRRGGHSLESTRSYCGSFLAVANHLLCMRVRVLSNLSSTTTMPRFGSTSAWRKEERMGGRKEGCDILLIPSSDDRPTNEPIRPSVRRGTLSITLSSSKRKEFSTICFKADVIPPCDVRGMSARRVILIGRLHLGEKGCTYPKR